MSVQQLIDEAKCQVKDIVSSCKTDDRVVISRYYAAVKTNFTDWMGKTIWWLRDKDSQATTVANLQCEQKDKHKKMLHDFATSSGALPTDEHYAFVQPEVDAVDELFIDPDNTAGLLGIMLLTVLENTSEYFIPDLEERAKKCGCTDFTYTKCHGVADIEHSTAFTGATERERLHYENSKELLKRALKVAVALIAKVYA